MALPLEKVLYSAHTHVTGGRDGSGRSSDGTLDVKLDHFASGKGGGTNPEQLFGVGYSACFLSAIGIAAQSLGVRLPAEASVDADVGLGQVATGEYQLGVKLNLEPKFFPANEMPAAKCVIALRELSRMADAIKLAHAVLYALWAEEKNTGDPATLREIIAGCGLDADLVLKASEAPGMAEKRESYTKFAIAQGVFGAPSFVIDKEIFWGQDRLDFVDRKLAA